jgi:hypothetical protein
MLWQVVDGLGPVQLARTDTQFESDRHFTHLLAFACLITSFKARFALGSGLPPCFTAIMIRFPNAPFTLAFFASVLPLVAARTAAARPMHKGETFLPSALTWSLRSAFKVIVNAVDSIKSSPVMKTTTNLMVTTNSLMILFLCSKNEGTEI